MLVVGLVPPVGDLQGDPSTELPLAFSQHHEGPLHGIGWVSLLVPSRAHGYIRLQPLRRMHHDSKASEVENAGGHLLFKVFSVCSG